MVLSKLFRRLKKPDRYRLLESDDDSCGGSPVSTSPLPGRRQKFLSAKSQQNGSTPASWSLPTNKEYEENGSWNRSAKGRSLPGQVSRDESAQVPPAAAGRGEFPWYDVPAFYSRYSERRQRTHDNEIPNQQRFPYYSTFVPPHKIRERLEVLQRERNEKPKRFRPDREARTRDGFPHFNPPSWRAHHDSHEGADRFYQKNHARPSYPDLQTEVTVDVSGGPFVRVQLEVLQECEGRPVVVGYIFDGTPPYCEEQRHHGGSRWPDQVHFEKSLDRRTPSGKPPSRSLTQRTLRRHDRTMYFNRLSEECGQPNGASCNSPRHRTQQSEASLQNKRRRDKQPTQVCGNVSNDRSFPTHVKGHFPKGSERNLQADPTIALPAYCENCCSLHRAHRYQYV